MARSPEIIRHWAEPHQVDGLRTAKLDLKRLAWAGRTSTYDRQDPTLSLPRQLSACQSALPENAVIVAHFYDIESGRKEASVRSQGSAHELFDIPIPRDGGIQELLNEAAQPDRRFDGVICEDIGRVGRRAYISTQIEHQLEQLGIQLVAVDEGVQLEKTGRRGASSTQVLTRRVKQGVAEWYVTEMLEKSWGGYEQHTEQGYNIGKPCYGYRPEIIEHPVPAKRAKGMKKTKLKVHDTEGAAIRKMFIWRVAEHLGYQAIADRLNIDLVTNPPPTPVKPSKAVEMWTYSNVREVLTNPKHTGHMVWNRRARKGNGHNRINPTSEWVWSQEPVHEPLIDLETFVQAQQVAQRRERSRTAAGISKNPQAKRIYRLRSYLYCHMCERRMSGNTMKGHSYYACAPKKAWRPEDHPTIFRVREDSLLDALREFLSTRIFGTYRHNLLDTNLQTLNDTNRRDHTTHVKALQSSITDTKIKSKNLLRSIEVADNNDLQKFQEFVREVNERRAELKAECANYEQRLAETEDQARQAPNPDLLHHLPIGPVDLTDLPDELTRRLFEALRLEIHYNHNTHTATYRVTLIGDALDTISQTAHQTNIISCKTPNSLTTSENDSAEHTPPALPPVDGLRSALDRIPRRPSTGDRSRVTVDGLCSAPGRIRTCDTRFRKTCVSGCYACYQRLQFAQHRITPVLRHGPSSFRTTIRTTLATLDALAAMSFRPRLSYGGRRGLSALRAPRA